MKKSSMLLITVLAVALLSMLSVPVHGGPPTTAEGLWRYLPTTNETVRVAGGNTFIYAEEVGEWTGTFEGESTEVGVVVIHSAGFASFKGIVSLVGSVGGKSGTLEIQVVGKKPDLLPGTEWDGKWVILSGTGDLANLRGHGTWWGPGWQGDPTEWGNIPYAGEIHFDPD
jgi:hypothetical protein